MTTIGQNIRKLRKERGMTQEELAAQLNISSQAVSKWEMETCSPDISQVIPLTTLFGVSADVLFGIQPDGMEKEFEETKIYCELHETTNEQALDAWMKLYDRYPHNNAIRYEIAKTHEYCAKTIDAEDFLRHYRKSAEFYEKILDDSTDHDLRSKTIYSLHHIYNHIGDCENTRRIANMGGDWGTLKAEMLSQIDGYEKKNYWCQEVFRYYGEGMAWTIMNMEYPDNETKIFALETAEKILDLTYCDGNKAWISYVYKTIYTHLAECYAYADHKDKLYEVFEKWYETACFEDNLPLGEYRYTDNPFMNEIIFHHDFAHTHSAREYILFHLKNAVFNRYRSTDRFKAYVEKVQSMPGIEFPFGDVDFDD